MDPKVQNKMRHYLWQKASSCPYPCRLVPGKITLSMILMIVSLFEPDSNVYNSIVLFREV